MSPDLLLLHPAGHQKIYQNLSKDLSAVETPVWALLAASFVINRGFSAQILDAEALGLNADEAAVKAREINPRLIAIAVYGHNPSASTQMMPAVRETCKALKEFCPDIPVLLFGGHASALPERTLMEESADYVSDGEGPATIAGLLEQNFDPSSVPDLWFRDGSKARRSSVSAPLIENLSEAFPALPWHLLSMDRYRAHNWHCFGGLSRAPYASLYTTLGCPYRCEFCCIQAPYKNGEKTSGISSKVSSYRFWKPEWVVNQIENLVKNYGVKNIKIADEMFVLHAAHVSEICDRLIEKNWGLNIWAYARVDTAKDPALLKKLKAAGFNWLVLGIEAADPGAREDVDKNFKQQDIFDSVNRVREAGISVLANYIFGLPGDSAETMRQTLRLALDLNTEFANFYCAMAYPGSALYNRALKENWDLPSEWSAYSQHSKNSFPIRPLGMSSGETVRFRDDAFHSYFDREEYRAMLLQKFGGDAYGEIKFMMSQRLERVAGK